MLPIFDPQMVAMFHFAFYYDELLHQSDLDERTQRWFREQRRHWCRILITYAGKRGYLPVAGWRERDLPAVARSW